MTPNINDMTIPKPTPKPSISIPNLNPVASSNLSPSHKQAFNPNNRSQINPQQQQQQSHTSNNMHLHAMHQLGYPKLVNSSGQPVPSAGHSVQQQHHSTAGAGNRFAGSVPQVSANQNFYQSQQHHVQMQQQIRNQQQHQQQH